MKIKTEFNPKPIHLRQWDWSAYEDGTLDYDSKVGWGATEQEAIDDLAWKLGDET